eukprot:112699_1
MFLVHLCSPIFLMKFLYDKNIPQISCVIILHPTINSLLVQFNIIIISNRKHTGPFTNKFTLLYRSMTLILQTLNASINSIQQSQNDITNGLNILNNNEYNLYNDHDVLTMNNLALMDQLLTNEYDIIQWLMVCMMTNENNERMFHARVSS